MISLELAEEIISRHARCTDETEIVSLDNALNRILAEDVFSDMDMPPFDKSAMDGYACRREDISQPLTIIETIAAGSEPKNTLSIGQCAKIMTGAKVPVGANCVITIEDTSLTNDGKVLFIGKNTSDNICKRGEDIISGIHILQMGLLINPQTMAVLASVGKTNVLVAKKLNIGVFCTGSELIEPDKKPSGVQIRNSNASQIVAQITSTGSVANYYGIIADNREKISQKINELLKTNHIVLITGGASVGDFDFIPEIFQQSGFTVHFQKIRIQPGKPVIYATYNKKHIFGLSGNPVSSFLQFELLVKP
ncbi:MAG: molybdopterin molybdotransferase MoeA [Chloroflexia bacterium]|nr:molybdopterin molybdotransferase MoeA [Chloroflexia bacterium]